MDKSTYKGHFKYCPQDGTLLPAYQHICHVCGSPVPSGPIPAWSVPVAISLLFILITSSLVYLHYYIYGTFQQDSCTLTATWDMTQLGDSTYGVYASPIFEDPRSITYTITNAHNQIVAQGSGALGLKSSSPDYPSPPSTEFYNQSQLRLSKTANCWYSPYAQPKVLWHQPHEWDGRWIWFWFVGTGVILFLLYWWILQLIVYPWQLARRGMTTVGIVIDRERRRNRYGHYYVSFVKFKTQTASPLIGITKIRKNLPLNSKQDVCYDPLNPLKNCKATSFFSTGRASAYTFGASILILLLLGAQALVILSACQF